MREKKKSAKNGRAKAKELDENRLRVIDETGSNLALTRLYARAPRGKRARGSLPRKRGKNVTLITALSLHGLGEAFLIDGAANGDLFQAYVEHILVPTLKPEEIVIMDNSSIHTGKKVQELIEALRVRAAFSADFSPRCVSY